MLGTEVFVFKVLDSKSVKKFSVSPRINQCTFYVIIMCYNFRGWGE